jgi:hypothetical protein
LEAQRVAQRHQQQEEDAAQRLLQFKANCNELWCDNAVFLPDEAVIEAVWEDNDAEPDAAMAAVMDIVAAAVEAAETEAAAAAEAQVAIQAAAAAAHAVAEAEAAEIVAAADRVAQMEAAAAAAQRGLTHAALNGEEVCKVSCEYLTRCTNGFAEDHLIGKGAFGDVYSGVDATLGVRFAVKRLSAALVQEATLVRAARGLQREVEVLSQYRHPNLIKLLGVVEEGAAEGAGAAGEPLQVGVTMLIYEIGDRGSLETILTNSAQQLTWKVSSVLVALSVPSSPPSPL